MSASCIKKLFLLFFLVVFIPLQAQTTIDIQRINASKLYDKWLSFMTLEHAKAKEEIRWGLMGRKTIPKNHGMTFTFAEPKTLNFWMFNCFVDLSVAYIDENRVIREIHQMKAYPEKMDPYRPVNHPRDIDKYPPNDPTIHILLW